MCMQSSVSIDLESILSSEKQIAQMSTIHMHDDEFSRHDINIYYIKEDLSLALCLIICVPQTVFLSWIATFLALHGLEGI